MKIKWTLHVALATLIALAVVPSMALAGDLSPEEQLGKAIFFDTRLSTPDGMSCASCHDPDTGFADPRPDFPVSQGVVPGRFGSRNANSVAYASLAPAFTFLPGMGPMGMGVYSGGQFWDGRASTLAEQAKLPFLNPLEMNNPNSSAVLADVRSSAYARLFRRVYGPTSLDRLNKRHREDVALAFDRVAAAIAAYEASEEVNSFSSQFDLYLRGEAQLDAQELSGLSLFQGKAACNRCHPSRLAADGTPPRFTSFHHANTGVPRNPDNPFYDVAVTFNPEGQDFIDLGTGDVVGDPFHYGRFKIPSLRNVAVTAPYMHNGAFADLHTVVDFYNTRDVPDAGWPAPEWGQNIIKMDNLGNLGLTDQEVDDIVAYLRTLTDGYAAE